MEPVRTRVDPLIYTTRWLVRSYEIDQNGHVNNAVYLNYAEGLTVKGVRGVRRTTIKRLSDGAPVANVLSQWVWVRLSDGRPTRVPAELVKVAASVTAATVARRGSDGRGDGQSLSP